MSFVPCCAASLAHKADLAAKHRSRLNFRKARHAGGIQGSAVRQAIRAAGARLVFLPKYSPDLNPIEQVFAKLKTLLRKAEARTLNAVSDEIAKTLQAYKPDECANYLRNAGYA